MTRDSSRPRRFSLLRQLLLLVVLAAWETHTAQGGWFSSEPSAPAVKAEELKDAESFLTHSGVPLADMSRFITECEAKARMFEVGRQALHKLRVASFTEIYKQADSAPMTLRPKRKSLLPASNPKRVVSISTVTSHMALPISSKAYDQQVHTELQSLLHASSRVPNPNGARWRTIFEAMLHLSKQVQVQLGRTPLAGKDIINIINGRFFQPARKLMDSGLGRLLAGDHSSYESHVRKCNQTGEQMLSAPKTAAGVLLVSKLREEQRQLLLDHLLPANIAIRHTLQAADEQSMSSKLEQHQRTADKSFDELNQGFSKAAAAGNADLNSFQQMLDSMAQEHQRRNSQRQSESNDYSKHLSRLQRYTRTSLNLDTMAKQLDDINSHFMMEQWGQLLRTAETAEYQQWLAAKNKDVDQQKLRTYVGHINMADEAMRLARQLVRTGLDGVLSILKFSLSDYQSKQQTYEQEFCEHYRMLFMLLAERQAQLDTQVIDVLSRWQTLNVKHDRAVEMHDAASASRYHRKIEDIKQRATELHAEVQRYAAYQQRVGDITGVKELFARVGVPLPASTATRAVQEHRDRIAQLEVQLSLRANMASVRLQDMEQKGWLAIGAEALKGMLGGGSSSAGANVCPDGNSGDHGRCQ